MNRERQISDLASLDSVANDDLLIVQSGKKGRNIKFENIKNIIVNEAMGYLGEGVGYHNGRVRGKSLGTSITDSQNTAIKNRTYTDMFLGDYWLINSVYWVIVCFEYYYNVGDTVLQKGNIQVVPRRNLYTAQMHTTETNAYVAGAANNITTNGYTNSNGFTTNLSPAITTATMAFGDHLCSHRIYCTSATSNGIPTAGAWRNSSGVELMNSCQLFGYPMSNIYDAGQQKQQFPLMALDPSAINTRESYWIQDTINATDFGLVLNTGIPTSRASSNVYGIRPVVTLTYTT